MFGLFRNKRRAKQKVFVSFELDDEDDESGNDGGDLEEPFIPDYTDYFNSIPTGEENSGYQNLYPYEVCGRSYGVSEKTGRPTNRKKVSIVYACSLADAEIAAAEAGVMPPYSYVKCVPLRPSDAQLSYARGIGIRIPFSASSNDVSALLTRYEDRNDRKCPYQLFKMATERRVMVSYFAPPETVACAIWLDAADKPALFCYMVYCRECGTEFGCSPLSWSDSAFTSFSPGQKEAEYIDSLNEFGYLYKTYSKRSSAYRSALRYIHAQDIPLP